MSRRIPLVVTGSVVLALGGITMLTGLVLAAVFGSGNALSTGPHPVSTPTRALVSSVADINGLSAAPDGLGQATIEVDATVRSGAAGAFVGVGRAEDVDRYLAGADVDLVTDLEVSPFRLLTEHRPGVAAPPAPTSQDFWVARTEVRSGTARLSWPVQDGDFRVVLMNADGSAGVDVDGRFAVVLPSAFAISIVTVAAGLGIAVLGAVLLALGLAAPRAPGPRPSPGSAGSPPPLVPAPSRGDARRLTTPPAPDPGTTGAPADTDRARSSR